MVIFALLVPRAHAADIFVPSQYSTIQAAVNAAVNGDTIIVTDSATYIETTVNISATTPLTIRATNSPPAILSGYFQFLSAGTVTTIEGFTIQDGAYGLSLIGADLTVIANDLEIKNVGSYAVLFNATGQSMYMNRCSMEAGASYGVLMNAGNGTLGLTNCVIFGGGVPSIYSPGAGSSLSLYNCTLAHDTTTGSSIFLNAGTGQSLFVKNTIFYQGDNGIFNNAAATVTEDYNLFYGILGNTGVGTGPNDIIGPPGNDPVFTNAAGRDYHILPGSAAIDAGLDFSSLYTDDLDGNLRPAGSTFDIGAYELGASGVAGMLIEVR